MPSGDDDILSRVLGQRRSPNLRGHFSNLSPSRRSDILSRPRGIGMPVSDAEFSRFLSPAQKILAWHSQAILGGYHTPQGENITYNINNPAHMAELQLAREAAERGQTPLPFGANQGAARSRVSQPQRAQDPDYNVRGSGFVGNFQRNLGTRYIGEGGRDLGAYYGGGGERLPMPKGSIGLAGSLADTTRSTSQPNLRGALSTIGPTSAQPTPANLGPNPFASRGHLSLGGGLQSQPRRYFDY